MSLPFPEPTTPVGDRADVLLGYLDFFRSRVIDKVAGLSAADQRVSRLPSGWTPLQMLKHLTFVEMRWLQWGFEGLAVADPWGDERAGRWFVDDVESFADVAAGLRAQGKLSTAVVAGHKLSDIGQPGPRWDGAEPPSLERILLHLVQEYARHLGQLDIVAEIGGGPVGE